MPNLSFKIISAQAIRYAPVPTLGFHIEITNAVKNEKLRSEELSCQAMVGLLPTHSVSGLPAAEVTASWPAINISVPHFEGFTFARISLACEENICRAFDQQLAIQEEGVIPIAFLFSGHFSYLDAAGMLKQYKIPEDQSAFLKMPASVWRNLQETYFPDQHWSGAAAELAP